MRVGKRKPELASLRSVEASTGYGNTTYHIVGSYALEQVWIVVHNIRCTKLRIPNDMILERVFETEVTHLIAPGIEVEKSVEADALLWGDESARGCVWLQAAAGTYANYCQAAWSFMFLARRKIDICKRIEFVEYNVDIVATYACTQYGYAFV